MVLRREKEEWPKFYEGRENSENLNGRREKIGVHCNLCNNSLSNMTDLFVFSFNPIPVEGGGEIFPTLKTSSVLTYKAIFY